MTKMDAARWRAVSAEVDRLLDLPADARETAIAALHARDAGLADDVAELLAGQPAVEAARFLEGRIDSLLPTATSESGPDVDPPPLVLQPGTTFGGYRLGRVLGRGGMGVVYEAEELASGRRVALKVLQRRHGDEYDRERFEREGRLAASIDHEHCVFVFGAEEIDGVPAIAMELMQGTLADRLADGPMAPAAAVDAALQLVAGLQAAQAAGILHRDVKPSNCFVDAGGVVKVGDFGISRSTRPTDETARSTRGHIAATPAYASPEQLSGRALDVRADIYSLGATLYELLTGERPFTGPDLMALLMAVANEPPRPPHLRRSDVPKGLSEIVLRCLAKRPEDRFQTYEALTAALESYAPWSPTPATLGRRLLAGVIDLLVRGIALAPLEVWLGFTGFGAFDLRIAYVVLAASTALDVAYYWLCESRWGATAGKAIAGVTVVDADGMRSRPRVVFTRVIVFLAPALLLSVVEMLPGSGPLRVTPTAVGIGALESLAILLAQFSTARRHNGYAAWHDLASGTRVVARAARRAARPGRRRTAASPTLPAPDGVRRGEFIVVPIALDGRPGWRAGYDPRLRRAVWIRDVAAGTPAIQASRAALARPTRLRWLAGQRTDVDGWDVYEAVEGRPLTRLLEGAWTWTMARQCLVDVARELVAQEAEIPPPLDVERVWVLDTGRAKLLDDPATDRPGGGDADPRQFLRELARTLRSRAAAPWPMSAERALRDVTKVPLSETLAALEDQLKARPTITRAWRFAALAPVVLSALVPASCTLSIAAMESGRNDKASRELRVPLALLRQLRSTERRTLGGKAWALGYIAAGGRPLTPEERAAIESFLAFRHRAALTDERLLDPANNRRVDDEDRAIVARVRQRIPVDARDGEAAAAHPVVRRLVRTVDVSPISTVPVVGLVAVFLVLTPLAVGGLALAVACRGGALRLLGFEVVTARGDPASRLRVLARAAGAWSPVVAPFAAAYATTAFRNPALLQTILGTGLMVFAVGAAYAVWSPARGIQDRLAGTWIVPR